MGGLLCSSAEVIESATVLGKRLGMLGVHKAGLFDAAGLVALREMYDGLAEDHRRARWLAGELARIDGFDVDLETVQTNLFRVDTHRLGVTALQLAERVAEHGLGIHVLEPYAFKMSLCYALDDTHTERALDIMKRVVS